jgi:ribonuclease J
MNCLAIEQSDAILVIDCGVEFPFDDLGVDVIHPDFGFLVEQRDRVKGIFLTHGHEDHIGALPYLLESVPVPVWGPPHTLELCRHRLEEHGFDLDKVTTLCTAPSEVYSVGPFEVEPIRVSHSIVEACALRIETAAGTVLHTGDFNLDPDPPDGEPTDIERLERIGDAGVRLLLSDSTNVDVESRRGSEREVGAALESLVRAAPERVVIALFASNIQRLILIGRLAAASGRKLCLLGRSLNTQARAAQRVGRLSWPAGLVVSPDEAASVPRSELLVLAGGTQAEHRSAMRRLASDTHPQLKLEPGDSVIFSSRIIPGNDRPIFEMIGDLLRNGLHVHTRATDPAVHTSGHAGRSEQRRMIEWVRPRSFVPIHGTLHHLMRHAELARSLGVSDVEVIEDGAVLRCDGRGLTREGRVAAGKVRIALGGEVLAPEVWRRRAELGRGGIVLISLVADARRRLLAPPSVTSHGVPAVDGDREAQRHVARALVRTWQRAVQQGGADARDEVARCARREIADLCGWRPLIEVQVLEVDGS